MRKELKHRYNQIGAVSDAVAMILVLIAFILGVVVCKTFG